MLGLLIYLKYEKQQKGCAIFNNKAKSYGYYLTTRNDDFSIGKERNRTLNKIFYSIQDAHRMKVKAGFVDRKGIPGPTTINADWINWNAKEGYCITDIESDAYGLANEIKDWYKECPYCGFKYIVSKKSKTDLCPNCYDVFRHEYKAEKERKRKKMLKNEG